MKIGLVYPQIELQGDPEAVRAIGDAAVELGYDYVLAYDHVLGASHEDRDPPLMGPYTDKDPFHDPFVMFAYMAGRHPELEFASGILILPQRQTVLVAKQAADLDLLCGERFRLGVGVGWNHVEYDALGEDFSTRGKRANEQMQLLGQLWTEPVVTFDGQFDQIDRGTLVPRPNRSIPLWVGGFSDPAYRRAVKYGDGFMFAGRADHALKAKDRMYELAAVEGRDMDGFGLEFIKNRSKETIDAVNDAKTWRESGGTHFAVSSMGIGLDSIEAHLDFFAEVKAGLG